MPKAREKSQIKERVIPIRLTEGQYALFSKLARAYGQNLSQAIRYFATRGAVNQANLALVTKEEIADALGIDITLVNFFLKNSAPQPEDAEAQR